MKHLLRFFRKQPSHIYFYIFSSIVLIGVCYLISTNRAESQDAPIIALGAALIGTMTLWTTWANIRLSHRAWLNILPPTLGKVSCSEKDNGNYLCIIEIKLKFSNTGKTPAYNIATNITAFPYRTDMDVINEGKKIITHASGIYDTPFFVAPGGTLDVSKYIFCEINAEQTSWDSSSFSIIVSSEYDTEGYARRRTISTFRLQKPTDINPIDVVTPDDFKHKAFGDAYFAHFGFVGAIS